MSPGLPVCLPGGKEAGYHIRLHILCLITSSSIIFFLSSCCCQHASSSCIMVTPCVRVCQREREREKTLEWNSMQVFCHSSAQCRNERDNSVKLMNQKEADFSFSQDSNVFLIFFPASLSIYPRIVASFIITPGMLSLPSFVLSEISFWLQFCILALFFLPSDHHLYP